jgi:hypothetical protein
VREEKAVHETLESFLCSLGKPSSSSQSNFLNVFRETGVKTRKNVYNPIMSYTEGLTSYHLKK